MREYDISELKEEQESLPPSDSNQKLKNEDTNRITAPESNTSQEPKASTTNVETDPKEISLSIYSVIYPAVREYTDQVVDPQIDDRKDCVSSKRKRQRRIYVAVETRCASLRSRRPAPTSELPSVPEKPLTPSPPVWSSSTPAEHSEDLKYIKPEHFKPEFWNLIEVLPEPKPTGRKRREGRNGRGGRVQKRRHGVEPDSTISPDTAAAIAAAQIDLDSEKPQARASRKTKQSGTMSLYDRRYQTSNDDQRRVANGYVSGVTGLRAGNSAGAGDIDPPELQGHQYYGPGSSNSNNIGSGGGLNGSGSTILNHVPSMGTLCNIGNTCYLNSVVYTLRFAPHFLHNLHHLIHDLNVVQQVIQRQHNAKSASLGRNMSGSMQLEHARSWSSKDLATTDPYNSTTNISNGNASNLSGIGSKKSSHQSVSEKLHDLYNSLHNNEMSDSSEPYHADTLLHAIQDVNATFEGNQQQDAHEFLMCVLNCIRETNQALIKAIGECPEVIANGYIVNPDDADTVDATERSDGSNHGLMSASGNGSIPTSQNQSTTTSKTSFFSRKSKRKDEVKSSKATRLQSPLKDNSPTTAGGGNGSQAGSNSLFYLNTVDLSGAGAAPAAAPATVAPTAPAKYSSDEDTNAATLLKEKLLLEERIRDLNINFFSSDFEGIVVLTTKCLSCETITRQKQGMLDISVPVPISGYDNAELQEKPSSFIQNSCVTREYFRGDNKYSCNQCTGYTEAIRSISYEVLPRLLVIQLNRFSGGMEKVSTYVPTTFTLPCFCAKCCQLGDGDKLHVYKLYSVITHVGATLTVGHYIAYTCFLDLASDYVNCPKDRRNAPNSAQQQQSATAAATATTIGNDTAPTSNNGSSSIASTPVSAAASVLASSGTSLIKKMKFGRSKASSSGDMSKNVKQLNGLTSKTITNGIGKLSMNTTCHGINCCAMRLCCSQQPSGAASNSASSSDFSEESLQNGSNSNLSYSSASNNCASYPTGYGSTGRGGVKANYVHGNSSEPIWYMCDDDKIKAMTQREFEELLSPTRKITITPYLLFYARFDLQQSTRQKPSNSSTPPPPSQPAPSSAPAAAAATAPTLTTATAGAATTQQLPQSSWSNDNLQSGLHKI